MNCSTKPQTGIHVNTVLYVTYQINEISKSLKVSFLLPYNYARARACAHTNCETEG